MSAVAVPVERPHHPAVKRLQIVRRRVARWFRPPEAELIRRHRLEPHPLAVVPESKSQEQAAKGPQGPRTRVSSL